MAISCLFHANLADSVEKAFRIAAQATKNNAYSCESSEELVQKCTKDRTLEKLTQNDLAEIRANLFKRSFDAEFVESVMSKTFQKMSEGSTMEDIFIACVSDEKYI